MRVRMLLDSSFLYALYDESDTWHKRATDFALRHRGNRSIVLDVVLTEAAFLFRRRGGVPAVLNYLDSLVVSRTQLEPILMDDLRRAREIMAHYTEARLDFVDCCIMALAERLNVTQVCTFDHRDFDIFRPRHCEYLELLP